MIEQKYRLHVHMKNGEKHVSTFIDGGTLDTMFPSLKEIRNSDTFVITKRFGLGLVLFNTQEVSSVTVTEHWCIGW